MRSMVRNSGNACSVGARFLAIGVVEAIVGCTGIAGAATTISWLLSVLFISVALLSGRGAT
jgi:uncharacterized membrane protein YtjA (UPF0391 family)